MFNFIKDLFQRGRDITELESYTGIKQSVLAEFSNSLPNKYSYHEFTIPKQRTGKFRLIHAPDDNLKKIQKNILIMNAMTVNDSATAYIKGKSIINNVKPHVSKEIIIKIDLKDFFPSITTKRVYETFRYLEWDRKTSKIISNISTYKGVLPQGAPSSPVISNIICLKLDKRLNSISKKYNANYTRYADDITFSFDIDTGKHNEFIHLVKKIISDEKFQIQKDKKIKVLRPHHRQKITGLVINQKINLPRETKRMIRAMEHKNSLGLLPTDQIKRLEGYKALSKMIAAN